MICEECRETAAGDARGWRAYIAGADPPVLGEIVFFCPQCALREFGPVGRRAADEDPAEPR